MEIDKEKLRKLILESIESVLNSTDTELGICESVWEEYCEAIATGDEKHTITPDEAVALQLAFNELFKPLCKNVIRATQVTQGYDKLRGFIANELDSIRQVLLAFNDMPGERMVQVVKEMLTRYRTILEQAEEEGLVK